ncbi:MAG: VaFE repeat-containing surface-anchored protein [Firmicutes bacterium]|nr:VaFE repeat-containing surface-anchored protein [Bacillota bacterium]
MRQKARIWLVIIMALIMMISGMDLPAIAEEIEEKEDLILISVEGWGAGFEIGEYGLFEGQSGHIEVTGDSENLFQTVDEHTVAIERSLAGSSMDFCVYTGWTYAEVLEVTHMDGSVEEIETAYGYGAVTKIDLTDAREVRLVVGTMERYVDLVVIDQRVNDTKKGGEELRSAAPEEGETTISLMPDSGHSGRAYDNTNGNHLFCLDMSMGVPSNGQTFYYSDLASYLEATGRSASLQALYFVLYNYWTNRYPSTGTPTYQMTLCSEDDWPYQNMITGVIWKLMGFDPAGYGDEYKNAIEDMAEEALAYADAYPNGRFPENSIIESVGALYPETGSSTQPMISIGTPVYHGYLRVHKTNSQASEAFLAAHPVTGAVYGVFSDESAAASAKAKQTSSNTNIGTEGTTATLTIGSDGYSEILELSPGSYWIVEIARPTDTAWQWDPVIHAVSVTAQNTEEAPVIVDSEELLVGRIRVTKTSSNTAATNGNACYDMTGIRFDVYKTNTGTSSAPALSDKVGSLTIISYDVDTSTGTSDLLEGLNPGTYWIQEAAGTNTGTGYIYDSIVKSVTVEPEKTVEVSFSNAPTLDPNRIQIVKSSSTQGNHRITESSATFKVEFFDNYTWSGSPVRTWYFKTSQGFAFLNNSAYLDPAYTSSALYTTSSSSNAFPLGSIRVTEEKAPDGYLASGFELKGTITISQSTGEAAFQWVSPETSGKLKYEPDGSPSYLNDAVFAGVRFRKADKETGLSAAQGAAKLDEAQISIYNHSGHDIILKNGTMIADGSLVMTLTTDEEGQALSAADALPVGSYYAVETTEPEGYLRNDGWKVEFSISEADHGTIKDLTDESFLLKEQIIRGGVALEKWDIDLMSQSAQGDADFAGISFRITTLNDHPVLVEGIDYSKGQVVYTLTTDEDGNASSPKDLLPYGKYQIEEIATNGKYLLTSGEAQILWIHTDGEIITANTEGGKIIFSDEVGKGAVMIEKQDEECELSQGDASFTGIRYAVVNRSLKEVKIKDTIYAPGVVVMILTLGEDGTAISEERALPYGSYGVYELRSNALIAPGDIYNNSDKLGTSIFANENGYLFKEQSGKIELRTDGQTEKVLFSDAVLRGGVSFSKIDRELDQALPQGNGTLEGAIIEIVNRSQNPVFVEGEIYAPGEVVLTLTTDENGICGTEDNVLPYGTYEAREKEASEGYLVSDWQVTFEIREAGEIVKPEVLPEQIKRCDIRFSKVDIDGSPMPGIPFRISLLDTEGKVIESHVIVSDANGMVNTMDRKKTEGNINILDLYVKDGRFSDESMLDGSAAVWFGAKDTQSMKEGKGALIYGSYRIEELQCEANKGQVMLSEEIFVSSSDEEEFDLSEVFTDGSLNSLGNLFIDLIIHPSTDLIDITSNSKSLTIGKEVSIKDIFYYDHLKIGQAYCLVTKIYYEDAGGSMRQIEESSIHFEPEKVDITNTSYGMVESECIIDSSEMSGGRIHAVSILLTESEGKEIELLVHNEDCKDERQMLWLPTMRTVASDSQTNDHIGTTRQEASIRDIVFYENLAQEHMYRLVAVLKEVGTGKIVTDAEGKECVVGILLRVSENVEEVEEKSYGFLGPASGELIMPAFVFDATAYEGKTLVVTELLFDYDLYDEELDYTANEAAIILRHDSLNDQDQQVFYPELPKEESSSEVSSEPEQESSSEISSKPESQPEPEKPGPNPPTGDHMSTGFYTGAIVMGLAAFCFVLILKHRNNSGKT